MRTMKLPQAVLGVKVMIENTSDDELKVFGTGTDVAVLRFYRLEFYPTNAPKPTAIWDCAEGLPGRGARLVAVLKDAAVTMEEAETMVTALNRRRNV